MTYAADDDAWPICIDQMWGMATDEEVERYLQRRLARLARREVHAQVIDARRAATMNADQRARLAEFTAAYREELGRWVAGVAFVEGSAVGRTLLRAVYGLQPPPYPTKVFAERTLALEWALARLREKQAP
ncbi:MAG: hypothetical protein H6719_07455 [Sandaracinaceae bacterium]|nr:hypothetical protein [Sandaracinaceae bacterium]